MRTILILASLAMVLGGCTGEMAAPGGGIDITWQSPDGTRATYHSNKDVSAKLIVYDPVAKSVRIEELNTNASTLGATQGHAVEHQSDNALTLFMPVTQAMGNLLGKVASGEIVLTPTTQPAK